MWPSMSNWGGGVRSQARLGRFDAEIVPITVTAGFADKDSGRTYPEKVVVERDEGICSDTTLEGIAKIKSAVPGGTIHAGNASQFSDGAAACVVMDSALAQKRGIQPLGIFRGFAVAGCEPDEMDIGPVFAVPRLLERTGMSLDSIGLWEPLRLCPRLLRLHIAPRAQCPP